MLINFSVKNFRSIKDKQTLNLKTSSKFQAKELNENIISEESNFYKVSTLKSVVIFGGNASGKSNILNALKALRFLVTQSSDFKLDKKIGCYEPFMLCTKSKNEPIDFSIEFIAKDGVKYRFEISFDKTKILKEVLYFYPQTKKTRKTLLYKRIYNKDVEFGTYYEGDKKSEIYPNQLFLSQVGTRPIKSLTNVYRYFTTYLYCSTIHDSRYDDAIITTFSNLLSKPDNHINSNFNKLIRAADTEIVEIRTKEHDEKDFKFPEDMPDEDKKEVIERFKNRIKAVHNIYDGEEIIGEEIFDITEESTGTKKLLVVGGLILDALQDGTTIIIDELDKSLHPLLTQMLIRLFNSSENNPNNAQLIFASHDVSLMSRDIFRLDQLFFAEKNFKGASRYFRLSEFTEISKVAPIAKWYLMGRFGATPMINEFELSLEFKKK